MGECGLRPAPRGLATNAATQQHWSARILFRSVLFCCFGFFFFAVVGYILSRQCAAAAAAAAPPFFSYRRADR